jgi:hypothetical protein
MRRQPLWASKQTIQRQSITVGIKGEGEHMSATEIMKQKLDIAKRAGELSGELAELSQLRQNIERKKKGRDSIRVITADQEPLYSNRYEKDGTTLHDLVLTWIDVQIEKREAEVNDLIKILS